VRSELAPLGGESPKRKREAWKKRKGFRRSLAKGEWGGGVVLIARLSAEKGEQFKVL